MANRSKPIAAGPKIQASECRYSATSVCNGSLARKYSTEAEEGSELVTAGALGGTTDTSRGWVT